MPSRKRIKLLLASLTLLILAAAVVPAFFPQQVLCVDSGPTQADVIIVLGGGSAERPAQAARLFRANVAPKIIVSGLGDCDHHEKLLRDAGVPAGAIQKEGKSTSTRDNARFAVPLLQDLHAKRVIIVTSWYHSRRALHCFRHYAPEIDFYSRPSYFAYSSTQWKRKGIRNYIRVEYLKLIGYWICYGVCPF